MFLKIILFGIFIWIIHYCNVVQGLNDEVEADFVPYHTIAYKIAREHLFVGDFVKISLWNLQIPENSTSKPPLVMMSVMVDKTLGYDIDPVFPYFTEPKTRYYSLDLNAAAYNKTYIDTPSTVAYKFDFVSKTLHIMNTSGRKGFKSTLRTIPPSSLVHLYPNISSVALKGSTKLNQTEQIIEMTSSKVDGFIFYNLSFVLFIDTSESEGLYKIYLYSYEHFQTELKSKVSVSSKKVASTILSVFAVIYGVIFSSTVLFDLLDCGTRNLPFEFFRIFKYFWPILKLKEYWGGYKFVFGASKMVAFDDNSHLNISGPLPESCTSEESFYYYNTGKEYKLFYDDVAFHILSLNLFRWMIIFLYVLYIITLFYRALSVRKFLVSVKYQKFSMLFGLIMLHAIIRIYDVKSGLEANQMMSYFLLISMSAESLINKGKIEWVVVEFRWMIIFLYVLYIITLFYRALSVRKFLVSVKYQKFSMLFGLIMLHAIIRIYDVKSGLEANQMMSYFLLISMSAESLINKGKIEWVVVEFSKIANAEVFGQLEKHFERLRRWSYSTAQCCLHIIFVIIVSFNFVLALMIWFDTPFHLYWIQIAVEETVQILLWTISIRPWIATERFFMQCFLLNL